MALALLSVGCAGPVPRLQAQASTSPPACVPAPFGPTLYLRGAMTDWALREDMAFHYRCDAYLLNVQLDGRYEFKIGDASSSAATTFALAAPMASELSPGMTQTLSSAQTQSHLHNLRFDFHGAQTLRLAFPATSSGSASEPTLSIGPQSFVDPATAPVVDPIARSLRFDSRDAADKHPFGAVTAGSEIAFALSAAKGVSAVTLVIERRRLEGPQELLEYNEVARVPLQRAASGGRERWLGQYRFAEIGVYGYYFEVAIRGSNYVYENNADPIYWTRELGSNGLGQAAPHFDGERIRRFRQTVYCADYQVPDWARDLVYYYIFPERFRNGDSGNDPDPQRDRYHDHAVEFHRDWLERPYLPHSGDGSDEVYGNDFFGGDLAGIIDKLDYIAALGANALYITPLFRAASNHKYDTADYKNIDPHFGSNADFERLTRAAAARGIRIILDTSLNHTGSDSLYFDRYDHYPGLGAFKGGVIQPASPYADWYRFDPRQTDPERQYHGWVGAQDLPELDKASPSFREFAFGAPDSVMKLWLDRGAAGWRMDVAPWVPDDFWRAWRSAVKQHRPDALTIAETQFDAAKFFLGDEFDSTMNYIFRNAVQDYANGAKAGAIYRNIELMRENYPPQAFYALMNLLSTHDSARALYEFGYHDAKDDPATIARAKQRLRLAVFFQMIFPGAPTIFYGDEVGVTGGDDPFNRVTYPWPDRGGAPDAALLADVRRLVALRREHAVLRHGTLGAPAWIDDHVIVLLRHDGARWAITATNNDSIAHRVTIALPAGLTARDFSDALGGAAVATRDATLTFDVPPLFGRVLLNREPAD